MQYPFQIKTVYGINTVVVRRLFTALPQKHHTNFSSIQSAVVTHKIITAALIPFENIVIF